MVDMFVLKLLVASVVGHSSAYEIKTDSESKAPPIEPHFQKRATTVFFDDFSSGHIDPHKWTHDITTIGNGLYQMYGPEEANSYVKNGMLYIKPTFTVDKFGEEKYQHGTIDVMHEYGACLPERHEHGVLSCVTHGAQNRPIISAQLRSKAHIKYGRVEVLAKMPKGDWIWPAIWMLSVDDAYGHWPRSGEIDIIETTGNMNMWYPNGKRAGAYLDLCRFNYGTAFGHSSQHIQRGSEIRLNGTAFAEAFHTYWIDWTADHIELGVDKYTCFNMPTPSEGFWKHGNLQGTNIYAHGGKNAPFDKPFYLLLDVAVAGNLFWNGLRNEPYGIPWTIGSPYGYREFWDNRTKWMPTWHGEQTAMKIKSVKMIQY